MIQCDAGGESKITTSVLIMFQTPEWICSSETAESVSTAVRSPRRCGAAMAPDTICATHAACTTK